MVKRKIKVYGKINLYETSVVGIPAHPDAHFSSDSFSLIKSMKSAFVDEMGEIEQLNLKQEVINNMSENKTITQEAPIKTAEVKMEKSIDVEMLKGLIKESIAEALKNAETERGLVEKSELDEKPKSLGEALLKAGLFKAY